MAETEDLNRLIAELNADDVRAAIGPEEPESELRLERDFRLRGWLAELVARRGSDLLLVAGAPASILRDGSVEPLDGDRLAGPEIERAVLSALSPAARSLYRERFNTDASLKIGPARFRVNLHRERGQAAAAIRALPEKPPSLSSLGLPEAANRLAHIANGLVLICGPTGSGKTTTVAALVNEINSSSARHIVTIEDPIEYEHSHRKSLVEQMEVGTDTPGFASALRAAMRQAPDVLVVGEMRDTETMSIALSAAETGHLVLSTIHASDSAGAIARLADSFPPERQATIRQEIALSLSAVLSQRLLPRASGSGRVAACELFFITYGARQHIRKNALQHLHQEISLSRKTGSITLEDSLSSLVRSGTVSLEEAREWANHPEEFESLVRR